MKKKIGIIGGGIGGLMLAYSLSEDKNLDITIYEKGMDILDRKCPILEKKVKSCIKCKHCAIMEGLAGAGAFSDGKYNITTEFGGWLQDIRPKEEVLGYIEKADKILVDFGATKDRFMPNNELKKLCLQNDLYMLQSQCKHLGTDANFETMVKLISYLKEQPNISIKTNTTVNSVTDDNGKKKIGYEFSKVEKFENFDYVIFAVGRVGSSFFSSWCKNNNVKMSNNQVDIGVRVSNSICLFAFTSIR